MVPSVIPQLRFTPIEVERSYAVIPVVVAICKVSKFAENPQCRFALNSKRPNSKSAPNTKGIPS